MPGLYMYLKNNSIHALLTCSVQVLLFAMNMSTVMKTKPLAQVEHHLAGSTALHLDRACQAGALKAGILGTFMAMISTPHRLLSRVLASQYSDDLPVINTKVRTEMFIFTA